MQISQHWRLNSQRYQLKGVRYEDGTISLQNRPKVALKAEKPKTEIDNMRIEKAKAVA